MSTTGRHLMELYQAMRARFGHQGWWPGESPFEICLGAILTQNTNWRNVEKALANLRRGGVWSIQAVASVPLPQLAELIRPAGYYNIKARRLKNFALRVRQNWQDDLEGFLGRSRAALREDLLSISGIGPETADSIVLYAAQLPSFVIDRYTARILVRHGLIDPDADYEQIKDLFESNLPEDVELFNDYHAQLVAVGKDYCRPVARCEGCPLEIFPHDRFAGQGEP